MQLKAEREREMPVNLFGHIFVFSYGDGNSICDTVQKTLVEKHHKRAKRSQFNRDHSIYIHTHTHSCAPLDELPTAFLSFLSFVCKCELRFFQAHWNWIKVFNIVYWIELENKSLNKNFIQLWQFSQSMVLCTFNSMKN